MGRIIDKTGEKFGRLTVIKLEGISGKEARWICQCDCGNETTVRSGNLTSGAVKSCGCYKHEYLVNSHTVHGGAKCEGKRTKLYSIWIGMRRRCYDRNDANYPRYGGRGIVVCNEWKNDFAIFREWAIKNGYSSDLTIDRIDNDKEYSPENCRWTGALEQARNRRSNKVITFNGETHTAIEWEEKLGFSRGTISRRITSRGWSVERALTEPIHEEPRGRWLHE